MRSSNITTVDKPDNITNLSRRIFHHIRRLLPDAVISLSESLEYELYAVGGCVRDPLLGREIGDLDLAVVGDAVKLAKSVAREIGARDVAVYPRFGTALVKTPNLSMEFASTREESYSRNSRNPIDVKPVDIETDLKRRDFTINAIAIGLVGPKKGGTLDLFNGRRDLARKSIRTPLEADSTFSDDPLRILRAIRFAAELNFTVEPKTWQGIVDNVKRLEIVVHQRIGDEFWWMICGSDPVRAMRMLIDCGAMEVILPEITAMSGVEQVGRHHHKDVLLHSLKVMQNVVDVTDNPVVRLAGLLHDIGKPRTKRFESGQGWTFHGHDAVGAQITRRICRRLRLGRDVSNRLVDLIRLHMRPINLTSEGVTDSAIRRMMFETEDLLDDQLILCRADITTSNPNKVERYLDNFAEMVERMDDVKVRDKMREFQSPVRGEEIMQLCDLEPGPMIGALKEEIEDAILDGVIPYDYDSAKEYLFKIKDEVMKKDISQIREERRRRKQKRNSVSGDFQFPDA